jgi:hypothetical protein
MVSCELPVHVHLLTIHLKVHYNTEGEIRKFVETFERVIVTR